MPSKPSTEHYQKASFLCTPHSTQNEDAELPTHPFRAPEVSSGLRREAAVTEKLSVTLCHPAQALQVQTPQEIARRTGALRLLHAAQAKASGRQEGLPQPLCGQHPYAGDQETKKGNQAGMEVVGRLGAEESRWGYFMQRVPEGPLLTCERLWSAKLRPRAIQKNLKKPQCF